ncbi:MAG: helix-turn-helix domain-containing protein [Puniceicoccaceae bacterium]
METQGIDRERLAYTRTEAARLLGVSPFTIDRLRKRGLLKCSLATRRPLFPHWAIEEFLRTTSEGVINKD